MPSRKMSSNAPRTLIELGRAAGSQVASNFPSFSFAASSHQSMSRPLSAQFQNRLFSATLPGSEQARDKLSTPILERPASCPALGDVRHRLNTNTTRINIEPNAKISNTIKENVPLVDYGGNFTENTDKTFGSSKTNGSDAGNGNNKGSSQNFQNTSTSNTWFNRGSFLQNVVSNITGATVGGLIVYSLQGNEFFSTAEGKKNVEDVVVKTPNFFEKMGNTADK